MLTDISNNYSQRQFKLKPKADNKPFTKNQNVEQKVNVNLAGLDKTALKNDILKQNKIFMQKTTVPAIQEKNKSKETMPKLLEKPTYKFRQVFFDEIPDSNNFMPFLRFDFRIYNVVKNGEIKIDFTKDFNIPKNNIKKYLELTHIKKNSLKERKTPVDDPITQLFNSKSASENLRFGELILNLDQVGNLTTKFEPFVIEEELCSDEYNNSRLENSDVDKEFETDEDEDDDEDDDEDERLDSDLDLDLDLDINDLANSSIISQAGVPSMNIDNLNMIYSNNVISPTKKWNYSPTKNLQIERNGFKHSTDKFNVVKKNLYSKFDNSMTISSKGILKMVDDSLVSSDTEIYNSFINPFNKPYKSTNMNSSFTINETDLIDILKDENEVVDFGF